jgi:hypothetical protein
MEFGSEMLSVDYANISKRDIGNNRCISWAKQNFSKVGGLLFYLCPSVRPRYFSSHFSQQLSIAEI